MYYLRPANFIVVDDDLSRLYNILEIHGTHIVHSGGNCSFDRVMLYLIFPEHVALYLIKQHSRARLFRLLELSDLSKETQVKRIIKYLRNDEFMKEVQEDCGSVTRELPEDLEDFAGAVIWWVGNEITQSAAVVAA